MNEGKFLYNTILRQGRRYILICLCKCVYLAYIHQAKVIRNEAVDGFTIADAQVEVYDTELLGPLAKIAEKRGIHVMDASKGQFAITVRILNFGF